MPGFGLISYKQKDDIIHPAAVAEFNDMYLLTESSIPFDSISYKTTMTNKVNAENGSRYLFFFFYV